MVYINRRPSPQTDKLSSSGSGSQSKEDPSLVMPLDSGSARCRSDRVNNGFRQTLGPWRWKYRSLWLGLSLDKTKPTLAFWAVRPRSRTIYKRLLHEWDRWFMTEIPETSSSITCLGRTMDKYVLSRRQFLAVFGDRHLPCPSVMKHSSPVGMSDADSYQAVCGIIMEMIRRRHSNMARATSLAVNTYMRPSEILDLRMTSAVRDGPTAAHWHQATWFIHRHMVVRQKWTSSTTASSTRRPDHGSRVLAKTLFFQRFQLPRIGEHSDRVRIDPGPPNTTHYVLRQTGETDDWLRKAPRKKRKHEDVEAATQVSSGTRKALA